MPPPKYPHLSHSPFPVSVDTQAFVDDPSMFEDLGFVTPEGSFLAEPCMRFNFTVDGTAEIMGTQVRETMLSCRLKYRHLFFVLPPDMLLQDLSKMAVISFIYHMLSCTGRIFAKLKQFRAKNINSDIFQPNTTTSGRVRWDRKAQNTNSVFRMVCGDNEPRHFDGTGRHLITPVRFYRVVLEHKTHQNIYFNHRGRVLGCWFHVLMEIKLYVPGGQTAGFR